ncbi:hypothetical protein ACN42_g5658 [Penicillium freii]|uniref:Uncharacterized protein n=1 Tax=Penicillium freii TaxID=48697 RepID=A0A124GRJ5_PENFR|nr:hypothetical protein ACN42_g5658 [Penicillium freii]
MAGRTYQPATYDTAPRKEQASVSLVSKNDDAHVGYVLPQRLNATGVPEQDSYAHQYSSLANSTSRGGGTNLHPATSPRRPRWTMPAVLLTPDSVQVFVQYYAREIKYSLLPGQWSCANSLYAVYTTNDQERSLHSVRRKGDGVLPYWQQTSRQKVENAKSPFAVGCHAGAQTATKK